MRIRFDSSQCGSCSLHLKDQLKMAVAWFFKTLVSIYQIIWRYSPETAIWIAVIIIYVEGSQ